MKWKSKCHRGRLGLLRWVVSSIATGDLWVSEERITGVHQIMPSRPTGCLRHGNVLCVPQSCLSGLTQSEHLWERFSNMAKTCIMQSSQQVKHDYKLESFFFFGVKELDFTHSEEDASSVSAPSPDCGTMSSSRAEWRLSLPRLATWSSSETKNWGGNTEHESTAYCISRQ